MELVQAQDILSKAVSKLLIATDLRPKTAIILGTGLGKLAAKIKLAKRLSYEEIPGFPRSTVESHHGQLLFGELAGHEVVAMQGRFHFYEGYSAQQCAFPIKVLSEFGIKRVFISNAAGGLSPTFEQGDLVLIRDHINLQQFNALRGPVLGKGPRFPDMNRAYDPKLGAQLSKAASAIGIDLQEGVYAAVQGPNLETPAEYRYLSMIGADLVGMSTVPEVVAAVQSGISVAAVSVVTDLCDANRLKPVDIEHIIAAANKADETLSELLVQTLSSLEQESQ